MRVRPASNGEETFEVLHTSATVSEKHSKRRIHLLLGEPHRIDILALRAHRSVTDDVLTLDVLPKLGHPSSRKSVRIGESSSIKGPISDDKDLEMNGPCHSTGSLSSERATTALSTNTASVPFFC